MREGYAGRILEARGAPLNDRGIPIDTTDYFPTHLAWAADSSRLFVTTYADGIFELAIVDSALRPVLAPARGYLRCIAGGDSDHVMLASMEHLTLAVRGPSGWRCGASVPLGRVVQWLDREADGCLVGLCQEDDRARVVRVPFTGDSMSAPVPGHRLGSAEIALAHGVSWWQHGRTVLTAAVREGRLVNIAVDLETGAEQPVSSGSQVYRLFGASGNGDVLVGMPSDPSDIVPRATSGVLECVGGPHRAPHALTHAPVRMISPCAVSPDSARVALIDGDFAIHVLPLAAS